MVKGFSIISVFMVLLILVVIISLMGYGNVSMNIPESKAKIQLHLYSMDSALDAAKLYMDVSLDYSVYQACYEVLKTIDPGISEDEFRQNLESGIKEKLNVYTKPNYRFLTDYEVYMAEYDDVNIESLNPLKVKATGKDMFIKKEDKLRGTYLTMEKDSSLEKTLGMDCYGIYQKGKEIHTEIKNKLESSIKEKIDSWPDTSPTLPDLDPLKNEIETIPDLVFDREDGDYLIKSKFIEARVEFAGYDKSGDNPYENIKYDVTVKLEVSVKDKRDEQIFPIYDGEEIIFSPLSMVFLFEESCTG
jgi:hypothetical protein